MNNGCVSSFLSAIHNLHFAIHFSIKTIFKCQSPQLIEIFEQSLLVYWLLKCYPPAIHVMLERPQCQFSLRTERTLDLHTLIQSPQFHTHLVQKCRSEMYNLLLKKPLGREGVFAPCSLLIFKTFRLLKCPHHSSVCDNMICFFSSLVPGDVLRSTHR